MATGIQTWSQTAASNANASTNINFAEGQAPSSLNDSCRGLMSEVAKWRDDLGAVTTSNGVLTTGGTANAQTLTTNGSSGSLVNGWTVAFKAGASNTSACTLNVDALGAIAINVAGAALVGGEIVAGTVYRATYHATANVWQLHNGGSATLIPSGTLMLFQQTAAPSGWTKQVTHNDKALRVVSGAASSGGSTAFSTIFASRTIAQANLPNVNLSSASLTGSVGTALTNGNVIAVTSGGSGASGWTSGGTGGTQTITLASGAVTFGGSVPLGGSGTAMDFAVQYVDLIIASKN